MLLGGLRLTEKPKGNFWPSQYYCKKKNDNSLKVQMMVSISR